MHTAFSKTVLVLLCCTALCLTAFAADGETLYNDEYCFSEADFSSDAMGAADGIFITGVPEKKTALIRLGNRTVLPGDVLDENSISRLRLVPACDRSCNAVLTYCPIYGSSLGDPAELTIRIQSGKNETPRAENYQFETYKNIENNGKLSGSDPENGELTFRLADPPKRGTVKLEPDGTFLYTPSKNKVGEDLFTFTVTDEAGNVSKPATVNITILNPSDQMTFADMEGNPDCFEAVWMEQTGLCSGRMIGTEYCFCPEEPVSRGEFLVMAMKLMEVPEDGDTVLPAFSKEEQVPAWLQPYLTGALRRGVLRGETDGETLRFRLNENITGQEAAVVLQNVLELPVPAARPETMQPPWAAKAVMALTDAGICSPYSSRPVTRLEAAKLLYQVSFLKK